MPPLKITAWGKPKSAFVRGRKKLDKRLEKDLVAALKELQSGNVPAGRKLKTMNGYSNPEIWEIRLTQNYRLTFEVNKEGIAFARNVGTHNVLDNP